MFVFLQVCILRCSYLRHVWRGSRIWMFQITGVGCLFNSIFRLIIMKASNFHITGPLWGEPTSKQWILLRKVCHCRDQIVYVPSQWEMTLHCNVISHWLGTYTKWSLHCYDVFMESTFQINIQLSWLCKIMASNVTTLITCFIWIRIDWCPFIRHSPVHQITCNLSIKLRLMDPLTSNVCLRQSRFCVGTWVGTYSALSDCCHGFWQGVNTLYNKKVGPHLCHCLLGWNYFNDEI